MKELGKIVMTVDCSGRALVNLVVRGLNEARRKCVCARARGVNKKPGI